MSDRYHRTIVGVCLKKSQNEGLDLDFGLGHVSRPFADKICMSSEARNLDNSESTVRSLSASDEKALFSLDSVANDLGRADTFRYNILTWVLSEKYDRVIQELREFHDKPSEYPDFHDKVNRYISHAIDLVYAIKAKRNFPGLSSLTRAKQQELREKFKEHFKELQIILKKVEKVETDLRIMDVRSTIYVVRAMSYSVGLIALTAFINEFFKGLGMTSWIVMDDLAERAINTVFSMLGF